MTARVSLLGQLTPTEAALGQVRAAASGFEVVAAQNNGAATAATQGRAWDVFVENVRRYARGEPLRNVVDKAAGYALR